MSGHRLPSALSIPSGQLPVTLPPRLEDVKPPLRFSDESGQGSRQPTTLFLTVDVEDSYFDRPILMTGEGIGREFGVFGILDEFDARQLKGTFFVNVYEKDRQPEGVVQRVVQEIAARGHEVGLHTHPSPTHELFHRPLFRLPRSKQAEILRWGAGLIANWTGEYPTSFRAGGYALNDDTMDALADAGIAIDSSCFFPSQNNHNKRRTVNAVASIGNVIEVPVTTVLREHGDGELAHRKLDLDWLSVNELTMALECLTLTGVDFAMFMMHSFSFIEKETRKADQPRTDRARFTSGLHFDRYVEVYGPKPAKRRALSTFLDGVETSSLRTGTMRSALPDLRAASRSPDIVPVVSSST